MRNPFPGFHLKTTIERDGKHYLVSTVFILDHGMYWLETMVFRCTPEGKVTSWTELSCNRYESLPEAEAGHNQTCIEFNVRSTFLFRLGLIDELGQPVAE